MKTLSKADLIDLIESNIPDDAVIIGFSPMLLEVVDIEFSDVIAPVSECIDIGDTELMDAVDGATHIVCIA